MRIAIYTYEFLPWLGGLQTVSAMLASAWIALGQDVVLVTDTPAPAGYDRQFAFRVVRRPGRCEWSELLAGRDVITSVGPTLRYIDKWLASGVAFGWSYHLLGANRGISLGGVPPHSLRRAARLLRRWVTRDVADYQIGVSRFVRDALEYPALEVVYNGYDPVFRPLPAVGRLGHFLFFGRLVFEKGIDTLVEAAAVCRERGTPVRVKFVGAGPDREALLRMIRGRRLEELLTVEPGLLGEPLVREINAARAVVVPSHWGEPFGLVVAESMACGKCVIAAADGGIPEVAGEAALLFPPRDAGALAEHMLRVAHDDSLVGECEKRALARAEKFTAERAARAYLGVFERAIAQRAARPLRVRASLWARRRLLRLVAGSGIFRSRSSPAPAVCHFLGGGQA